MSGIFHYIAAFAVVIGVLVVFHELGHYLAARYCGVKVLRFSFGFGPVLWQRCLGRDQTEWAFSAFPLGGYVKMLDEREAPVASSELHRAFNRQSVAKRSLIVVAGPLANFLLAILLYWGVFVHGVDELSPLVGAPPEGTPAAQAGLRNETKVNAVDGEPVATWNDFRWVLLEKAVNQESVELELTDGSQIEFRRLYLSAAREQGWEGDALERLGIRLFRPEIPAVIGKILDGGPAQRAGIQIGDRIVQINGEPVLHWLDAVSRIREGAGKVLDVELERAGGDLHLQLTPELSQERGGQVGKIGVVVAEPPAGRFPHKVFVSYGMLEAFNKAVQETWSKSVFSLVMLGKMLTGEVSWRTLSGPVTIADYAGQSARLGLEYYLRFMALVSISLGVLNLLPVPVLDGGHLMYHMLEVVRRKPLSERAMEISQQLGLAILLVLMAFAFFNDLSRLFNG